ncbi:MAG: hypothetical protein REI95_12220 [Oxalicibacterium faecigallinarum]|uniref:hypothetical protein n=1 Tax=Oxalicibacterium faecigallinarum TaxID=573741 RepID=UPI00280759CE|nr:hypothetical protein [Oxalicibacterium faecigallinarum]MDQ7970398.1 hypothetical protein [Oxalicibacterium faecigallinarum]
MSKFTLLLASLIWFGIAPAKASDLTITCDVQQTPEGQKKTEFKRRFEIDFEPRYFKTSVDNGKGWRGREEGFPEDINATRVVFIDDGKVSQYYDRATHEYVYQDVTAGIEAKGKCREEGQPKK